MRVSQETHAVHVGGPKTATLRSLFTSLSHGPFGRTGMNQYAQRHRGALVRNFCIERGLNVLRQLFICRVTSVRKYSLP